MSNDTDQTTEVDPKVVEEAARLGWTPKEKFRGDAARWVDAQTYLDRGHQIMPILRKTNERLEAELAGLRSETQTTRQTIKELRESLQTMTEFQAKEVKRQVDAQIAVLKADKKAAIAAGDREQEAEITDQLDTLKDQKRELDAAPAAKKPDEPPPRGADQPPQWAIEFANDNSDWWMKDPRKQAIFMVEAEEARKRGLSGRALLDAAKAEMEKTFEQRPSHSKVDEGSGGPAGGGGGGSGGGNGKSYADLPSEAKAVIEDQKSKMVGPNRPFKDMAAWKSHYVKTYFGDS